MTALTWIVAGAAGLFILGVLVGRLLRTRREELGEIPSYIQTRFDREDHHDQ